MDSTAAREAVPDFMAALDGNARGVRIGVPRAFVSEGVDASVLSAFDASLEVLRGTGATLVDIDLPHAKYAIPVYYLVCTAEASSNLARYDGVKYGYRSPDASRGLKAMYEKSRDEGFGPEVKRRIMLGTYVLSAGYYDAFYLKAQQVRTLLKQDYERAFESVDLVVMPTSPTPPFKLGEKTDDPLQMYLADIFTVSVNLVGLPGISVPCGFVDAPRAGGTDRLPIGLQLVGRMFDEATDAARRRRLRTRPRNGAARRPRFSRLFALLLPFDLCLLPYYEPPMEPLNRRDLLRTVAALGVAAGAGRTLEAQTVSDTTRFFPGFKSFKVKTSGAEINGVIGGSGPADPAAARCAAIPRLVATRGAEARRDTNRGRSRSAWIRRQQQAA